MVYDCWLDIPSRKSETPDAQFAITTKTVVFDHLTGETYIVITPFVFQMMTPETFIIRRLMMQKYFKKAIRAAKPLAVRK